MYNKQAFKNVPESLQQKIKDYYDNNEQYLDNLYFEFYENSSDDDFYLFKLEVNTPFNVTSKIFKEYQKNLYTKDEALDKFYIDSITRLAEMKITCRRYFKAIDTKPHFQLELINGISNIYLNNNETI